MLFGDFTEARPRNFGGEIDEEDFAEDYGYSSDSDLEDEEDQLRALQHTSAEYATQSEVHPIRERSQAGTRQFTRITRSASNKGR